MLSVTVMVSPGDADLASGLLWGAGASGIEERMGHGGRVLLIAAVDEARLDEVTSTLDSRWHVDVEEVDPGRFDDAWRAWARPVRVGAHLVVQPVWVRPIAHDGEIVVLVEPGRAWGHGAHPSTILVLEALLEHGVADAAVLDVGCGSGVLSVAAALLGASAVVAIDLEQAAVEATRDNAERNGMAPQVDASTTPLADVDGHFDVVVANIGAATLRQLAADLGARAAPGGALVLSGVLDEQAAEVARAYEALGWRAGGRRSQDGWTSLLLTR